MVRKWMDGRTVKGDTFVRGTHSAVSQTSWATDAIDEGPSTPTLCMWDEGTRDRSGGARGGCGWREGADSLEFDKARRVRLGGRVRGSKNEYSVASSSERNVWTLRGAIPRRAGSAPAPTRYDRCHSTYLHPSPPFQFMHVAQGLLPSHLWWDEVNPRDLDPTLNTYCLPPPDRQSEKRVHVSSINSFRRPLVATHRRGTHAWPIRRVDPEPLFFTKPHVQSSIPISVHLTQRGMPGTHLFE